MLLPLLLTGMVLGGLWLYAPRTTQGSATRPPPAPPPGPQPRPRRVIITSALAGTVMMAKIGDLIDVSNSSSNETFNVVTRPTVLNLIGNTPTERFGVMDHYHAVGPGTATITFQDYSNAAQPKTFPAITIVVAPSQ